MIYRRLGRTGLNVSVLGLGAVELGLDYGIPTPRAYGKPSQAESIRLVHAALDAGINLIDTARAYGSSETVLGHALQGRREQVILATKAQAHAPDGRVRAGAELRARLLASLHTSLAQLRTDYVDIWQIHNVDHAVLAQTEALTRVFEEARQSGKVRWFGGSFYGADAPMASLALDLFDVMQVTYSVLDRRLEDAFFPTAQTADVGVVARSVLLQGALTERAEHLPEHLEELRDLSRRFRQLVARSGAGLTPAQAAVAFALQQQSIHTVLIGVRSETELNENLGGLTQLPRELLAALHALRLDDPILLNPGAWDID